MFRLLRFLLFLGFVAVFIWFGTQVPLGKFTLFQHFARIWKAKETQDLVDGTKETAGPAIEKVKRGVKAGVDEANKDEKGESFEKLGEKPKPEKAEKGEKTEKREKKVVN